MSISRVSKNIFAGGNLLYLFFLLAGCEIAFLNPQLGVARISTAYKVQVKIETTLNGLPSSKITNKGVNVKPQKIAVNNKGELFFTSTYLAKGLYQLQLFGWLNLFPKTAETYFPAGMQGVNFGLPNSGNASITDVAFKDLVSLSNGQLYALANDGGILFEVFPEHLKELNQPTNYFTVPFIPEERKNKSVWTTSPEVVHSASLQLTRDASDNIYILNSTFNSIWRQKEGVAVSVFQNPLQYEYKTVPPIFEGYRKLPVPVDGKETLIEMNDIAVDSAENMFILDTQAHKIYKITSEGAISTYAGTGEKGIINGAALEATFSSPSALVSSPRGTLFVADKANHCIRRISKSGAVTTLAGTGIPGPGDWPLYAISARSEEVV